MHANDYDKRIYMMIIMFIIIVCGCFYVQERKNNEISLAMRQGGAAQAAAPAEQEGDAASLVYQHGKPLKDILFAVEEECLRQALQRCATMHEAAQMLGMHPTTLWRKLAQHNMGQEGKA